ncbi:MAG: glutamate N-acetyltransferase/amino-acid N-acetyltransferase [Parasphingorhabdus sp.]
MARAKSSSNATADCKFKYMIELPRSPLAPEAFPENLPVISGLSMSVAEAGVKYAGRTDLWLAELAKGSVVAGVLTRSKTSSAPVDWCRKNLRNGSIRALLVNSGNANAFTGSAGARTVQDTAEAVASRLNCSVDQVYLASTGVIGEILPIERVVEGLDRCCENSGEANWLDSAGAIMTTDTFPKAASASLEIAGAQVSISGICKGSGMIAPDMATMLGFVFTDFNANATILQALLDELTPTTFNSITVDSDTSTSDTVLLISTCQSSHSQITCLDDPAIEPFKKVLKDVMQDLAVQIVKDGEGASKLITIDVAGAESDQAARLIGLSIANSPLVKTAIAGEDANWGRVVMAVGKAGEKADRDLLSISMGGVEIASRGAAVDDYDEDLVAAHLKGMQVSIAVDLAIGEGSARIWTCDLTEGYIRINADYRS